mmetsp:Transcript_84989/g.164807  ORF Transcript_84989/g.164807 Transcript_84989/m.164807 type:complete len:131 (-) Transcript_84989:156-548(-)
MGGGFAGHGGTTGKQKQSKDGSGGNPMGDMLQNMMGGMMGGMGKGGSSSFSFSSSSSSSFSGGGVSTSTQTTIKNGKRVTRTVTRGADGKETIEESADGSSVGGGQGRLDGSTRKSSKSKRRRQDQQWGF